MESKLIVIEGLDGAGKSTQVDLLMDYFKDKSILYRYVHFPVIEGTVHGELVAKFLRGDFGGLHEVHPQLVALLFALNRLECIDKFESLLNNKEDTVILFDRYIYSNIALQCAKLDNLKDKSYLKNWILKYEFTYMELPKPDLWLYLDVPKEFIELNLKSDRQGSDRNYLENKKDIHESNLDFQLNVKDEYEKLTMEDSSSIKIQCYDDNGIFSKEKIHLDIVKVLQQHSIV